LGLEAIGSARPEVDAEIIALAWSLFGALEIRGASLLINSVGCPLCTPQYLEKLREAMRASLGDLCEDCQTRFEQNPMRMLDCKLCHDYLAAAPKRAAALCGECDDHLVAVKAALDLLGVPYTHDHTIVRGLDYYTKTVFEFRHDKLGAQDALMGGGRYDGLVEELGGKPTPGVGFGLGLERALLARHELGVGAEERERRDGVYAAGLGAEARQPAIALVYELRRAGIRSDADHFERGLRAQMKQADKGKFAFVAMLGEDELAAGQVTVRDLVTGAQESVSRDGLLEALRRRGA
jgi:histidyl-tRNA synthetase